MEERIHSSGAVVPVEGEFVLYWVQITLRARDNFAFNFAVEQANRLRQPVLVYHGLRPDYPCANDRIHTFILESARDLEQPRVGAGHHVRGLALRCLRLALPHGRA